MTFAMIIGVITATKPLIEMIVEWRNILRQNGELTKEQEAELDAQIAALQNPNTKPPHWQIDP